MKFRHHPIQTTSVLTATIISSTQLAYSLTPPATHYPLHRAPRTSHVDRYDSPSILRGRICRVNGIPGLHSQSTQQHEVNHCTEDNGKDQSVPRIIETKVVMADDAKEFVLPDVIETNILKRVYPKILRHMETYGNPNIPLGSKEGNYCKALRKMAFQNTLLPGEVEILTELGFRWNNFEDVYDEADFDNCLDRLILYEEANKTGYQIAKKYKPDPELGAWVTVIRRKGRDKIEPERRDKLDAIKFVWISTRKCGSAFQLTHKALLAQLEALPSIDDVKAIDTILEDDKINKWFEAQVANFRAGTLSDSRCAYMDRLPGLKWRERMDKM